MPIEIRELVIKATVEAKGSAAPQSTVVLDEKQKRALVAEAVEQTFDLLRRKKER